MYESKIIGKFVSILTFGGDILFWRHRFPSFGQSVFCDATSRFSETSINFSLRYGVMNQERKFQAFNAKKVGTALLSVIVGEPVELSSQVKLMTC
jgi:hypothetical protein